MTDHGRSKELREEGGHLFDRYLAAGIDTGRYRLVAEPGQPTRVVPGPNFLLLPAGSWGAEKLDEILWKGHSA